MIFISYRSLDGVPAKQVRSVLMQHGFECWMAPKSIPGGRDYAECIPDAIDGCDVFVLILSKKTYKSKWVPKELDRAINCGKHIIPIHIDASQLPKAWDFKLENMQIISAYNRFDEACNELLRAIGCVPDKQRPGLGEDDAIVCDEELAEDEDVVYDEGLASAKKRKIEKVALLFLTMMISVALLWPISYLPGLSGIRNALVEVFRGKTTLDSSKLVINVSEPNEGQYLFLSWDWEDARITHFSYVLRDSTGRLVSKRDGMGIGYLYDVRSYELSLSESSIELGEKYTIWVGAYDENEELVAQGHTDWNIDCFHRFNENCVCEKCGMIER